jgi:hypothetical protein
MKRILWGFLALSIALFAESEENIEYIKPKQFKVDLLKNCEVLMLHEKRDRKSKTTHTFASNGDCVQNMGCIRDITQKELESMDKNKRQFAEWKKPVWCKVSVGSKQGWIQRQYLADKPCGLDQ